MVDNKRFGDPVTSELDWKDKKYGKFTYEEYRKQVQKWCHETDWYSQIIDENQEWKKFLEGKIGGSPPPSRGWVDRVWRGG
ncbi:hypothetical protein J4450_03200 [Candidatus Micrarchaeota archaeon]|nr:hypothetical protein [Candidatus Micrarchaeota archaeon]